MLVRPNPLLNGMRRTSGHMPPALEAQAARQTIHLEALPAVRPPAGPGVLLVLALVAVPVRLPRQ